MSNAGKRFYLAKRGFLECGVSEESLSIDDRMRVMAWSELLSLMAERGVDFDNEFCYADNFRDARVASEEEMAEFSKSESGGCCGSYNFRTTVDGVEFILGFNYGH